ncbi:MAG: glycogen synthase GlgA [Clostridia bacterium]|nr:glycogen synthase GlgA [Clostridia bacterium]
MKILFAASEGAPFIKSGGLGDVIGSLPPALSKLPDTETMVFVPYYKKIKENPELDIEFVTSFYMPLAWRNSYVGIFKAEVKGKAAGRGKRSKVTWYFIDNDDYFNRDSLYGYPDDGERFAYFSKAILEAVVHLDIEPDVIHCNDWQTGFLPLFLKSHYCEVEKLKKVRTVYTIHNIEYQGKAEGDFLGQVLGVGEEWRNVCTQDEMINAMKTAIVLCDRLSTVSETYANEIQYAYFAHGLENIISENKYKTLGIVNGIDTVLYNPEKDTTIDFKFKATDLSGKAKCKAALQKDLGLPVRDDVPIVAMITRLVKHKGLELVEWVADNLANMDIQLVVVGTGDEHYEEMFKFLSYVHPETVCAKILFDPVLANRIYAASDFFLMPSKSEPCGLSQLIAMRYGSVPIVRETGGLVDTVQPYNIETGEGRGFTFKVFNAHDMLGAVERAAEFFKDKTSLDALRKKIMKLDTSWKESAEKYMNMYQGMLE